MAEFYSINGTLVKSARFSGSGKQVMSIADLSPGVYFIKMISADDVTTIRIIKY